MYTRWVLLGLCAIILGFSSPATRACNVPVFRYALQRWPADRYTGVVFAKGALSTAEKALVASLNDENSQATKNSNLSVEVVDTSATVPAEWSALTHSLNIHSYPYLVIRYPEHFLRETVAWHGTLTPANVKSVLSSPAREKIAANITHGDAAVFVVLASADAKKTTTALKALTASIAKANAAPPPPAPTGAEAGNTEGIAPSNLPVHYSMVTISPTDARETIFVSLLHNAAAKLGDMKGVVVCPFFGQGRALCSLPEKQITDDNLQDIYHFLAGDCSCQVKDANPGVDMLFSVDWSATTAADVNAAPPLMSLASLPPNPTSGKSAHDVVKVMKPLTPLVHPAITKPIQIPGVPKSTADVTKSSLPPSPTVSASKPAASEALSISKAPQPALWRNSIVIVAIALLLSMLLSMLLMRNGRHTRRQV